MKTEQEFRSIPRLRYRIDEDQSVLAYSTWKAHRQDHLSFWGPGELALYYKRDTSCKATNAARWWTKEFEKLGTQSVNTDRIGDGEGILVASVTSGAQVPKFFLKRALGAAEKETLARNLAKVSVKREEDREPHPDS